MERDMIKHKQSESRARAISADTARISFKVHKNHN